jgi:hypothetical protein
MYAALLPISMARTQTQQFILIPTRIQFVFFKCSIAYNGILVSKVNLNVVRVCMLREFRKCLTLLVGSGAGHNEKVGIPQP